MGVFALLRRLGRASVVLGVSLLVFGTSDLVEAHTGAWYSDWWLIAWKGICIVAIVWSGWIVRQRSRKIVDTGDGSQA